MESIEPSIVIALDFTHMHAMHTHMKCWQIFFFFLDIMHNAFTRARTECITCIFSQMFPAQREHAYWREGWY